MRAFVLSGGGNYGALQAGALQVLYERGLRPDVLVGASAGALNAAWLATHPSPAPGNQLARIWREEGPDLYSALNPISAILRIARGKESILSNEPLREFILRRIPAEATFGEYIRPRLYVVAARLSDGCLRVFGDRPDDRILDGLMASTAIPPLLPPWRVDGEDYVDGGVFSDLPLQVAALRGADEIIGLLNCAQLGPWDRGALHGGLATTARAVSILLERQAEMESELIRRRPGMRLDIIHLRAEMDPGFWNFEQAEMLVAAGRSDTERYFERQRRRRSTVPLPRIEQRLRDFARPTSEEQAPVSIGEPETAACVDRGYAPQGRWG
jgi:NTE family protein